MEYLMTYGWAILVIAIALGVLYYLVIFNGIASAPRAQPGSCQVFRPNGPDTTTDINLEGACNNELPEYVAQFNGNSYVEVTFQNAANGGIGCQGCYNTDSNQQFGTYIP